MPMSKTIHRPIHDLCRYPALYHGDWGTGKTTLVGQYKNPYFLMFEPNNEYALVRDNVLNWDHCVELCVEFLEGNHDRKTIIFDNIEKFYNLAANKFMDDWNNNLAKDKKPIINLSGAGYSNGYDAVERMINIVVNPFIMSNKYNVVFIAHTETRQFDTISGDSFHKLTPRLPNKRARAYFLGAVSNIFYYYVNENKRYLRIAPSDFVLAKNRGEGHFLTTKGEPVENIPCGNSAQTAYKYLKGAYENKLKSAYKDI